MDGATFTTSQFGPDGQLPPLGLDFTFPSKSYSFAWSCVFFKFFCYHVYCVIIHSFQLCTERFGDGDASQIGLDLDEVITFSCCQLLTLST